MVGARLRDRWRRTSSPPQLGVQGETDKYLGVCAICGIPVDSQYFDDSGVEPTPEVGKEVVLAHVELPPQYCGVLEYFSQFTDLQAKDASQVATPMLEWRILVNNRPLYPYVGLKQIINPWGYGSFPVNIRLEEGTTVEFAVRRVSTDAAPGVVGGRIVGRYWYNPIYGDVVRGRS